MASGSRFIKSLNFLQLKISFIQTANPNNLFHSNCKSKSIKFISSALPPNLQLCYCAIALLHQNQAESKPETNPKQNCKESQPQTDGTQSLDQP
jgi:hypothetical protein